jgi:hypothetical protein
MPEAAARTQIAGLFRSLAVSEGMNVESNKIPNLITRPGRRGLDALNPRDTRAGHPQKPFPSPLHFSDKPTTIESDQ